MHNLSSSLREEERAPSPDKKKKVNFKSPPKLGADTSWGAPVAQPWDEEEEEESDPEDVLDEEDWTPPIPSPSPEMGGSPVKGVGWEEEMAFDDEEEGDYGEEDIARLKANNTPLFTSHLRTLARLQPELNF